MRTLITVLVSLVLAGCADFSGSTKSDLDQARHQEQAAQEANAQSGFPGITAFTEKKMVKMLYELRDKKIATFTYAQDMQGKLWHVCDSIGFGLPYGVQYTNPEKDIYATTSASVHHNLPQPEPNGLFMPPTAEGTWVMCAGPKGEIDPMYIEPRVVVSTHKLHAIGSWQE